MQRTAAFVVVALLVAVLAGPAWAQSVPATPQPTTQAVDARATDARQKLRRNIYVMEGALVRAVEFGVKDLNRKLRSAVLPEMMALSGAPQARGVYLDGYGIYFDVSVPVLNQVMMWSWQRMLGPDDATVADIQQLRNLIRTEKDPGRRLAMETALMRLELQLGPVGAPDSLATNVRQLPGTDSSAMVAPNSPSPAPPPSPTRGANELGFDKKALQDPNTINRFYTESVQDALIDVILDQATPLPLKADEFLTVAARDNMQRDSLAPFDPHEEVVTILLRLKGSDLAAYRAQQIDQAELRKRIEVREF